MIRLSHLVAAARSGDPEAVEAILSCITPGLRLLYSHRVPAADAEIRTRSALNDAIQEIQVGSIASAQDLIHFLRPLLSMKRAIPTPTISPTKSSEAFNRRIRGLSERKRQILYRRYEFAQSTSDICREMRVTEETVLQTIAEAKELFRLTMLKPNVGSATQANGDVRRMTRRFA